MFGIRRNLSNAIGWRTNRKIIVIESDDWGSVRTFSQEKFIELQSFGLNVNSYYNQFDSLESDGDLEELFNVLLSFKDINGNHPVFTPMCIMGNPDFEKIIQSDYSEYFFEDLYQTLKKYPNRSKLLAMWRKGIDLGIFRPGLHGREHINVRRFMRILNETDGGLRYSITNFSVGASGNKGKIYYNYLGALYPETTEELKTLHSHLLEAGSLFEKYCGYRPTCFIAPNKEEPKQLESTLKEIGIKYLTRSKIRKYPLSNGKLKREFNWLGKVNNLGQTVLVRNAHFEPTFINEQFTGLNWVESCLNDIEIAFRWKKPAIISTHRVNFVGFISKTNREQGLKQLNILLSGIMKRWPDVEFMSSEELGRTIEQSKKDQD